MKNVNKILNILTAFMAVIGVCAAALVCFIVIYISINGSFSRNEKSASAQEADVAQVEASVNDDTKNDDTSDLDAANDTEEPVSAEEETDSSTPEVNSNTSESASYNINGVEFGFSDSVANDVTGKWRVSSVTSPIDITEYAVDYYNTLFSSDDEIHAIVNFSSNTTTSISVINNEILDVAVHEYVTGEEHDAMRLFSGALLGEYWINKETGEVETITASSGFSPVG